MVGKDVGAGETVSTVTLVDIELRAAAVAVTSTSIVTALTPANVDCVENTETKPLLALLLREEAKPEANDEMTVLASV